jgi:hypothetical protein
MRRLLALVASKPRLADDHSAQRIRLRAQLLHASEVVVALRLVDSSAQLAQTGLVFGTCSRIQTRTCIAQVGGDLMVSFVAIKRTRRRR